MPYLWYYHYSHYLRSEWAVNHPVIHNRSLPFCISTGEQDLFPANLREQVKCPVEMASCLVCVYITRNWRETANIIMLSSEDWLHFGHNSSRKHLCSHAHNAHRHCSHGRAGSRSSSAHRENVSQSHCCGGQTTTEWGSMAQLTLPSAFTLNEGHVASCTAIADLVQYGRLRACTVLRSISAPCRCTYRLVLVSQDKTSPVIHCRSKWLQNLSSM